MADTQTQQPKKPKEAPKQAPKEAKGQPKGEGAPKVKKQRTPSDYKARLRTQFEETIRGALTKQFNYTNAMQVPRITKVVLNMGIGEGVADRKKVESAAADLSLIAGQKAVITKSRKSIATYKLRDGQAIGCMVTLRKTRMYDFDGRGNFSLGIKEHIVFPEIDFDKAADVWGLDVTVCTSARNDTEARALLAAFNFPFRQ